MTVPILTMVVGVILWCTWLTVMVFSAKEKIAVNTANDKNVGDKFTELKTDMITMKSELKTDFRQEIGRLEMHMNQKLDGFLRDLLNKISEK